MKKAWLTDSWRPRPLWIECFRSASVAGEAATALKPKSVRFDWVDGQSRVNVFFVVKGEGARPVARISSGLMEPTCRSLVAWVVNWLRTTRTEGTARC